MATLKDKLAKQQELFPTHFTSHDIKLFEQCLHPFKRQLIYDELHSKLLNHIVHTKTSLVGALGLPQLRLKELAVLASGLPYVSTIEDVNVLQLGQFQITYTFVDIESKYVWGGGVGESVVSICSIDGVSNDDSW